MRVDELVGRSGALKREVLAFATGPRFTRALDQQLRRRFGSQVVSDEEDLENFFDRFVQQYRQPDGRTVVDCFLETRPDLPDAEREFLRGWRDVREGAFEVVGRDGSALLAVNLIDDLEYRIRANVGPAIFDGMPPGSFLVTRVVPVHGEWLVSGVSAKYPAEHRETLFEIAAMTALQHPELLFRNPERLTRAWALQREHRAAFVQYFGADIVVLAATELPVRMREYVAACHGDSPVMEEWAASLREPLPRMAKTVGVIFDDEDGLGVFADFRTAEEVFADPALIRVPRYRRLVKTYLTDESVTPVPLVRLAERDHEKADRVFGWVTRQPHFSWADDGEALLREHKPRWYEGPRLPRTVVFGERLAPYVARHGSSAADRSG